MASVKSPSMPMVTTVQGGIDAIPHPFRSACKFVVTTQGLPLDRAFIPPTTTTIESKLSQDRTDERVASTAVVTIPDSPFTGYTITPTGQLGTVSYKIGLNADLGITPSALVVDGSIVPITADLSVQTVTTTSTLFPASKETLSQEQELFKEFITTVGFDQIQSQRIAGTAITQPTSLSTDGIGVVQVSCDRVNANVIEQQTHSLVNTAYTNSYSLYGRNQEGQNTTTTVTRTNAPAAPTLSALVIAASTEPLGYGWYRVSVTSVSAVFSGVEYIREIILPRELLHRIPTYETASTIAGTAGIPSALGVGDLLKKEQQVTKDTKRVTARTIDVTALPFTFTSQERVSEFGGAFLMVVATISTSIQAIDTTNLAITEFSSNELGNGLFLTIEKRNPIAWATITDYDRDPVYGSKITVTHLLVDATTYTPPSGQSLTNDGSGSHGVVETYHAIDKWRGIKTIETYSKPATYSEYTTVGHRYPRIVNNITFCSTSQFFVSGTAMKEKVVNAVVDISFEDNTEDNPLPLPGIYSVGGTFTSLILPTSVDVGNLNLGEIIVDEFTITWCGISITFPASSPNATGYNTLVGDGGYVQVIGASFTPWRGGLWKRQVTIVPLE